MMNIHTGALSQLTSDGHPKWGAVLSADHVAWIDQRRMVQLPRYSAPISSSDVFVRNRHTGEERRITDAPASRHGLRISGACLIWQDNRQGLLEDHRWDFDIYAYDLERDLEIPVAVTPGREDAPAIHGERVVWTHNPNRPPRGLAVPGSTARPDNRFNIFSYNLATEEEKALVETGEHNVIPSIHGGLMVWQRFRGENGSDIILLNLGTGEQVIIGPGGRQESSPSLSEGYAIWRVSEACDVGGFPRFRDLLRSRVRTGVYAFGLRTGEVSRLSGDKEPRGGADRKRGAGHGRLPTASPGSTPFLLIDLVAPRSSMHSAVTMAGKPESLRPADLRLTQDPRPLPSDPSTAITG